MPKPPAGRLLETVWSAPIGRGLIDCHYDEKSETVSVGDLSGLVVIVDAATGAEVDRMRVDMPVWGIAHRFGSNGLLVAAALADKRGSRGAVVFRDGDNPTRRLDCGAECWDVCLVGEYLYWTCWDGTCGRIQVTVADAEAEYLDIGGPAFGLVTNAGSVYTVVSGQGILRLTDGRNFVAHREATLPEARYNLAIQPSAGFACGSVGAAPLCSEATFAALEPIRGDIAAVGYSDDLLLAGTLEHDLPVQQGHIALYAPDAIVHMLGAVKLPGAIWNLAVAENRGVVYAACEDGSLYCIAVEADAISRAEAQAVRHALGSIEENVSFLTSITSRSLIAFAAALVEESWDGLGGQDLEILGRLLESWSEALPDDRLRYLTGRYFVHLARFDDAVVTLQGIDPEQDYYTKSLMPLSLAFEGARSISSAVRILQVNLDRFSEAEVCPYLFRIGELNERRGDNEKALQAYEAVSYLQHAYPGVRDALARLAPRPTVGVGNHEVVTEGSSLVTKASDFESGSGREKSVGRRRDKYDLISYIRYEASPPSDDAKKTLETGHMHAVVKQVEARTSIRSALDIGCATGRWPTWIARHGYEAHGYDISQDAINICENQAASNPDLDMTFHLHDLADGPLLEDHFSLVTCMMGTFNHIPRTRVDEFLRGVARTITPDGLFAFTTWNASSPFCDFLQLDGQAAKDTLRKNAMDIQELSLVLERNGLRVLRDIPMCFLPNHCYDVWEDSLVDVGLIRRIDEFLAQVLSDGRPQMHFLVAERSDREEIQ